MVPCAEYLYCLIVTHPPVQLMSVVCKYLGEGRTPAAVTYDSYLSYGIAQVVVEILRGQKYCFCRILLPVRFKHPFLAALVLLGMTGAMLIFAGCTSRQDEKKMILQTFSDYRRFTALRQGSKAVQCIDAASVQYYNDLLPVILYADSATVHNLSYDRAIIVFSVRHTATVAEVREMNGKTLFEKLVKMGLVNSDQDEWQKRYHIAVRMQDDEHAEVEFLDTAGKAGVAFGFVKENDLWKLNIPSGLRFMPADVWAMLEEQSGLNRADLVAALVESITGVPASTAIWQPMMPRP